MFEFIKLQYQMGKISVEQLESFVPKRITQAQADKIKESKEVQT